MRIIILFFFILLSTLLHAQNKTVKGVVKDSLGAPLPNANIIASPSEKGKALKFSIADDQGRYSITLENDVTYTLTVSYMGFADDKLVVRPLDKLSEHDFVLKSAPERLQEIVIQYDIKPIVIKKDTLTYNVNSFTNGSERKLGDQLKKLPGVEVDPQGNVTLQGKRVTTLLVENDPFFGGGTKLGVQNIPADAVEKVEFIDHFNDVAFLKEVSGSQQLALNIKLKKDKKNFVFGDIEGASGPTEFYKLKTGLFYYGGPTTASYIGDLNNIGDSTLDFSDIARFSAGSDFLTSSNSTEDLFPFASDNRDVTRSKSQFSAANFAHRMNQKASMSGYVIGSRLTNEMRNNADITYFQNETSITENRINELDADKLFFLGKLKFKYKRSSSEQWNYDANFKITDRNFNNFLTSESVSQTNSFDTKSVLDELYFNQYLEWHKSHSENKTSTFVVSHTIDNNRVTNDWETNQPFLNNFLPFIEDVDYKVNQQKRINSTELDALFKYYWVVNNFSHLYFIAGNKYIDANLISAEQQVLSDGTLNDFSTSGFGNDLQYRFNDANAGLEYKFLFKKWITKASLYFHNYNFSTQNVTDENRYNNYFLQPQLESEFEFEKGESLTFNYKLTNEFSNFMLLTNRFQLQSYQSVFRGNSQLTEARQNFFSLFYKKTNLLRGYVLNLALSYSKKENAIRNAVVLEGINQFSTPIQNNVPEENALFRGTISKNIYKFNVGLNAFISTANFVQPINNETNLVKRTATNFGVVVKTADKKWPFVTLTYNRSFDAFKSVTNTNFYSDRFAIDYDLVLNEQFVFKAFYDFQSNFGTNSSVTQFQTTNFSIGFQPKNSAWTFELDGRNIFGNTLKNTNSFSAFLLTNQTTFVLPRIIMLSATFKL